MPEKFDLIVVGAGIAGLSGAYEASKKTKASIAVIEKTDGKSSNSHFAQGGIAAAVGTNDSWKSHFDDTINAGCGLCNERIAEIVTKSGPGCIKELTDLGLEFDGGKNPNLGLEGGHGKNRILHINGDQTGAKITEFLRKITLEKKNIHYFGNTFLQEIATEHGTYAGIKTLGKETEFISSSLLLATGGYGAVFEKTTNPPTTLGNGIAIAQRAGCELLGMEFVQFHPTTLLADVGGNYLVSEAVRGEGGKIVDEREKAVVNPLDTRDKVSIAIYRKIKTGGKVFLDAREFEPDFFRKRFPTVYRELMRNKINPENDLIPIETAAHYTIGGIRTNDLGATNIHGIYSAGECTNSGLHGANRLASNSLLEGLAMGKIAARNSLAMGRRNDPSEWNEETPKVGTDTKTAFAAMKKIMWQCCGVLRDEANLKDGLSGIQAIEKRIETNSSIESITVRNALLVCRKTFEAALARKESIGTHYRVN